MELKAKLVSRWAASILECLKHLHPEERGKKEAIEKEERDRERERKREREKREMS